MEEQTEQAVSVQKFTWKWTKRREQAALLVAQDELTDEGIAAAVGVTRQALAKWKRRPEFAERVAATVEELRQAILARGIADKVERIRRLDDLAGRLQRVMVERAADPTMRDVPGGGTGLLVRQAKLVKVYSSDREPGAGDDEGETLYSAKRDVIVYEYPVDTGLTRELREAMKQAAVEKGEWAERHEHTGKGGGPIAFRDLRDLSDDELAAIAGRGSPRATGP